MKRSIFDFCGGTGVWTIGRVAAARGAEGVENARGLGLSAPTRGLGSVGSSLSGVRGAAPAANGLLANFKRKILHFCTCRMVAFITCKSLKLGIKRGPLGYWQSALQQLNEIDCS